MLQLNNSSPASRPERRKPLGSARLLLLLLAQLLTPACQGQDHDAPDTARRLPAAPRPAPEGKGPVVPKGYYLFPIRPGQPNFLAASMGELRPNHFHGGLDIKTGGGVDLPVYASADGYISRMKQSTAGYGNVLYIVHPNGTTTVYGHLNRFMGPVAQEMLRRQYEKKTYELELFFEKGQFPVKRGEVVALSGNTGGSAGPHLHWEVRDAQDRQYNPLQWGGFPEIQDHIAPTLQAFAVEPLSIESRVQGRFDKAVFVPKTATPPGKEIVWPDTIAAFGTVGLQFQAFDRFDNAWNKNGVQRVDVLVNGKPHYSHEVDAVPFPEGSRQIGNHVDYEWQMTKGRQLQKLWVDDGNDLTMYTTGPGRGRLRVEAGRVYTIEIRMADSYGNATPVRLVLRGEEPRYFKTRSAAVRRPALRYEVTRNLLKVFAADPDTSAVGGNLLMARGRQRLSVKPSYTVQSENVYLYDLRAGMPDSMRFGNVTKRFERQAMIPSGQEHSFTTSSMHVVFGPRTLFDTLYFQTSYQAGPKEEWTVFNQRTPLYLPYRLTLRPATPPADPARSAVYLMTPSGGRIYQGGKWNGNEISLNLKQFGTFRIFADTIPPSATLVSRGAGGLVFKVGDNLSGLASYQLEIGGQFRLLRYEHKKAILFTERQDTLGPALRGPATLTIRDMMGNERVLRLNL
ncbi:M23 family metallopeptidase [Hymenobacter sp. BT175]|uniref:M23 family metallopeptidase n=1 Tax=Hymenobacter translucens TaxID=2886507 RepID=UPI001D0EE301|nr:M23 family metallopeptidase [Hymenobacter translucens]MCC2546532.1 M23 family metallopeptidase [Hymenobacter translucens]